MAGPSMKPPWLDILSPLRSPLASAPLQVPAFPYCRCLGCNDFLVVNVSISRSSGFVTVRKRSGHWDPSYYPKSTTPK